MDFSTFVASLRRHIVQIVTTSLAAGLIVFFGSWALPKSFNAEARLYVGSLTVADFDQQRAYETLAQAYAQLASTTPVLERVRSSLGLTDSLEALATRIDVRAPTGLSIVRISATAPTADEAAALGNALAGQLIDLAGTPAGATEKLVSVVQPALPPPSPSWPRPALNAIVAVTLAFVIGSILGALVDRRRAPVAVARPPEWPEPQAGAAWRSEQVRAARPAVGEPAWPTRGEPFTLTPSAVSRQPSPPGPRPPMATPGVAGVRAAGTAVSQSAAPRPTGATAVMAATAGPATRTQPGLAPPSAQRGPEPRQIAPADLAAQPSAARPSQLMTAVGATALPSQPAGQPVPTPEPGDPTRRLLGLSRPAPVAPPTASAPATETSSDPRSRPESATSAVPASSESPSVQSGRADPAAPASAAPEPTRAVDSAPAADATALTETTQATPPKTPPGSKPTQEPRSTARRTRPRAQPASDG